MFTTSYLKPEFDTHAFRRLLKKTYLLPLFLASLLSLSFIFQIMYSLHVTQWVDHTDRVIAQTNQLMEWMVDAETGLRGYLLTDKIQFLEPYDQAIHNIEPKILYLKHLVSDDFAQVNNFNALSTSFERWQTYAQEELSKNKKSGPSSSEESRPIEGKKLMDHIRSQVQGILNIEDTLQQQRLEQVKYTSWVSVLTTIVFGIFSGFFLAISNRKKIISLSQAYESIRIGREKQYQELHEQDWMKTGNSELSSKIKGNLSIPKLCEQAIQYIATYTGAKLGALYVTQDGTLFDRVATYGFPSSDPHQMTQFQIGEGLLGQAAKSYQAVEVDSVPANYTTIRSSFGSVPPDYLFICPLLTSNGEIKGVTELGYFGSPEQKIKDFLLLISENLALSIKLAFDSQQLNNLLKATKQQAAELQKTNQFKAEFMANISHELRTPLNSCLILAKLLSENREKTLTSEQVQYAHTIYSAGNDLLNVINDILDLSKVDAGKLEIRPENIEISSLLYGLERIFGPVAKEKKLKFKIRTQSGLPLFIRHDRLRLEQILKNFLSNAFKFTETGSVSMIVSQLPNAISFLVHDTGIGISTEDIPNIFEAFRQGDGSITRKYGGTGLGLSISKDLATLMGGSIQVESKVGKGSNFTLILPIQESQAEFTAEPKASRSAPTSSVTSLTSIINRPPLTSYPAEPYASPENLLFTKQKIMIVDDDARNLFVLTSTLEKKGAKIIFARNGLEGFEKLNSNPDISMILMDIIMPKMNGFETIRKIRQHPQFGKIPIIAISAKNSKEDQELCTQLGVTAYFPKPLDFEVLLPHMQKCLAIPGESERYA